MTDLSNVNKAAPLRNVAAFSMLIQKVVERPLNLPGMACFFGPSGLGKSVAAAKGANMYRAPYVECDEVTTTRSLLEHILKELGVEKPRGDCAAMRDQAVLLLAGDISRPLIIDEAHHIVKKRHIDVVRSLHDKSLAPIILIGEETLPMQLEEFERVHNRMLDWVAAQPSDLEDFGQLAKLYSRGLTIEADLAHAIVETTRGNTRRICVNITKAQEIAKQNGTDSIGLALFGGHGAIIAGRAPAPRRGL